MSKTREERRHMGRAILESCDGQRLSMDKHRRRRQHRTIARQLLAGGTFLNATAPRGSIPWAVAQWHLQQARTWKR